MAEIKSFTDISQSKKLAEMLPIESADGFWEYHPKWYSEGAEWEGYEDYPRAEPYFEYTRKENEWKEDKSDVPCWSLASLLGVLLNGNMLVKTTDGKYYCFAKDVMTMHYDNPIDACVEMIIKLHEKGLL